jgi:hypothetical protein
MAECFLFLRSQLLSGRWDIFMHNVACLTRRPLMDLSSDSPALHGSDSEFGRLPMAA